MKPINNMISTLLPSSSSTYRADIDGLRAVAVLMVVFFHAFPSWVPGGFIGVDVFFVISGFLISTIIFSDLEKNVFSLREFYSRRIRRIFPALFLVLGVCYLVGWVVLLSDEYKQLGKHIVGGVGFISNIFLWHESGYFDNAAETKPLLHLWSLGIEEQFYIFWPLFLIFVWRRKWGFFPAIAIVGIISFIFNIYMANKSPVADFYSPLTRFWELMVGGLLSYISLYKSHLFGKFKHEQSIFGFLLLMFGLIFIDETHKFPGWWALLPTVGAFFIISAGSFAWINNFFLSNKLLVWLGLISFPIYLWHWPLLVFARILASGTPSIVTRLVIILVSVALAWLTYKVVEQPIRVPVKAGKTNIVLISLMLAIGFAGFNVYQLQGLPFRKIMMVNPDIASGSDGGSIGKTIDECGIAKEEKKLFANCLKDIRQTARFALLGDSKSSVLIDGLIRTSTDEGRWLYIGGTNQFGAPIPVLSDAPFFLPYQKLVTIAINAINENKNIETVVLATGTRHFFPLKDEAVLDDLPEATNENFIFALDGLNKTIDKFIDAGKKVVIVVDNPTLPDPKDCLARVTGVDFIDRSPLVEKKLNDRCNLQLDHHIYLTEKYRHLLLAAKARHPEKVAIFDTTKYMCDIEIKACLPYKNGRFLYSYSDHISDYAASLIGKDLNEFLLDY